MEVAAIKRGDVLRSGVTIRCVSVSHRGLKESAVVSGRWVCVSDPAAVAKFIRRVSDDILQRAMSLASSREKSLVKSQRNHPLR